MVVAYTETPANDENRHKAKAEEEEEVQNNIEKMGETVGSRRQQQSSWATTCTRLYQLKLNQSSGVSARAKKKNLISRDDAGKTKKNSNKYLKKQKMTPSESQSSAQRDSKDDNYPGLKSDGVSRRSCCI
jgi:hypothetical protein